jgi:hypothetical protein
MLNPFFLQGSNGEQNLVQDLINEQLRMYGVEVYYLPRQFVTERTVIREVIESEFKNAYPLEAYVDNFNGYSGQGTILSKFGIQELDDLTLIISKERFETYITPLISGLPNIKTYKRPKEGDLIWFPLGDRIFEIKYVEHEKPFYQLQKNYVYELQCELFRYGDEVIDTGIQEIDDNTEDIASIRTLKMVGIGSTATAITSIVNGGVRFATVTNRGSSYSSVPTIGFSSAPTGSRTASGIATMIYGIVDFCEVDETLGRVQGIEMINVGSGYTVAPGVAFYSNSGVGAAATSTIGDGIVGVITVTSGGSGYANAPSVTFTGISSVSAQARSIIENGSVREIRIINAGLGYSAIPTIAIGSPVLIGSGKYEYNEVIVGSISSTSARVKSWNAISKFLEVSNITGDFIVGETLTGQDSGATYVISEDALQNLADPEDELNRADIYAANNEIQIAANEILDFSERNPFGTP